MKRQSITSNAIMNIILTLLNILYPLITFPYIVRILGASGVGEVQFAMANLSYLINLASLGIPLYGTRAVAQVRNQPEQLNKVVRDIWRINGVVSMLALGLFIVLLKTTTWFHPANLYLILSTLIIFNTLSVEWFFKGMEDYRFITRVSLSSKLLALVLMVLWVNQSEHQLRYAVTLVIAAGGLNGLYYYKMRQLLHTSQREHPHATIDAENPLVSTLTPLNPYRTHIKAMVPFAILSLMATLYSNIDATLLGLIHSPTAVGYYVSSTRIKFLCVGLVTSVSAVLMPRMAYYYNQRQYDTFNQLVEKAMQVVLWLALPGISLVMIFARPILAILFGTDFVIANSTLRLQMISVLFIGLSNITGIQVLIPMHQERVVVMSSILGAISNLLLNLWLIPKFGLTGAALANTISEALVLAIQLYQIGSRGWHHLTNRNAMKILVANTLSAVTLLILLWSAVSIHSSISVALVQLVVLGAAYVALYSFLLYTMKEKIICHYLKRITQWLDARTMRS